MNKLKIIMVDALIGNDYSTCLCESISSQNVEVHMIVPENRNFPKKVEFEIAFLSPSKDKAIGKLQKIYGFITYIFLLRRYVKVNKCDLVHYQFFRLKIEMLFFKFLKLRGVNLVVTAHNVLPHERSKIDYFLISMVYKNANAIIVHSNFIKNKLLENFSLDPAKVRVIPHGNFDMYLPEKELNPESARSKFSLTSTDNVILFFGFIRPYKGLDLLIQAFKKAAEFDPNLKLLIAGSTLNLSIENAVKSSIIKSKFKDRIIDHLQFIPNEDIAEYFSASDLVVMPYRAIDHSGIVHLAYSFGKAVLATNVGDFNEVIINNKSGKIIEGNSFEELSEAIIDLFKDKSKLVEMGKYARLLSNTKYSWTDIAKQTIQLYSEVVKKQK